MKTKEDSTFRTAILRDAPVNWPQDWLDKCELEPYVLYNTIRLGHRHCEVLLTKVYSPRQQGYTKMKPITGWWSVPVVCLGLGRKK